MLLHAEPSLLPSRRHMRGAEMDEDVATFTQTKGQVQNHFSLVARPHLFKPYRCSDYLI